MQLIPVIKAEFSASQLHIILHKLF